MTFRFPDQVQLLSSMGFEKTACFQALEVTRNQNKKKQGEGEGTGKAFKVRLETPLIHLEIVSLEFVFVFKGWHSTISSWKLFSKNPR